MAGNFFRAVMFFLLTATIPTAAQTVSLAWSPSANPAVAGFKIYYGPASRVYTNSVALGNVTNATIGGLVAGGTYYFAATTYDAFGNESTYSSEVVYTVPLPVVTNTTPVVTNAPPVITNTIPVVTNTPPAITNTIPVITNTPPVITNTIPVITNTPPVITNTIPVITNTPPTTINSPAAPTLNPVVNTTVRANTDLHSVALTGLSAGKNNGGGVSLSASSSDPTRVFGFNFQMTSSGNAGTLYFNTTPNTTGPVVITITVSNTNAVNNTFSQNFTITLINPAAVTSNLRPPTFFRRPANTVAIAGHAVSLVAGATGQGLLKYSWKFNGKAIPGAASPTLTLSKVTKAQAGVYTVTVASQYGSTNSVAALSVVETYSALPQWSLTTNTTTTAQSVTPSPAATLGQMTRAADGNFTFPVTGIPGYKYVVQASTDLTHWTSIQTNTSPFVFEDTQTAGNDKRFFRAYYDPAL